MSNQIEELDQEEYEDEHFERLTLINADLRDKKFIDCVFDGCALSSVKIDGALVQSAFRNSKIEGINFFYCETDAATSLFSRLHYSAFFIRAAQNA